jgi:hypothetical protein
MIAAIKADAEIEPAPGMDQPGIARQRPDDPPTRGQEDIDLSPDPIATINIGKGKTEVPLQMDSLLSRNAQFCEVTLV